MKPIRAVAALVLALFVAGAIAAQDNKASNPSGSMPKLVIASPIHDFGEIKAGTPLRHAFKVRNEGKGDLRILNVAPS